MNDTEQENSRLITLMLQVATMDGKLDATLVSLTNRVQALEDKANGAMVRTLTLIGVIVALGGVLLTLGGKLVW